MKRSLKLSMLVSALGLFLAAGAFAQAVPNAGFDITGYIQAATKADVGATPANSPRLQGGTLTVNGIEMIVPNNSIVQMPAASFTWADLFGGRNSTPVGNYVPARPAIGPARTGLALVDPVKTHHPAYEVRVVGNIVRNPVDGSQTYIVGMILPLAQSQLGAGSGYINYVDYDGTVLGGTGQIRGRFRVGGIMGDPNTGTLCELNDPVGRYGDAHSPDPRFTVDYTNPTVTAATGYPVCIHRGALATADPDCPTGNRPLNGDANFPVDPFLAQGAPLKTFTMPAPTTPDAPAPNPYKMVPLMEGDWIDYNGTVMLLDPTLTRATGRDDPANMFVSVHSITAHLGIRTAHGTQPHYLRVEEFLFGVGDATNTGPTVLNIAQETSTRVALVAFTTDTDGVAADVGGTILGIHVDPATGAEQELQFPNGSSLLSPPGVAKDDFVMDDPIRGRIRWNPAKNGRNQPGGAVSNAVNPQGVTGFNFYREYVMELTDLAGNVQMMQLPDQTALQPDGTPLPGLIAGQYRLPIFDYIFGEGTNFGQPIPPFNFHEFGFLNIGSGRLNGPNGPVIGPLDPFPTFQ